MGTDRERIAVRIPGENRSWELVPLEASPCTLACPTRINVRGYVTLISDGRFAEALALIRERNPFPGVCGRICPRPCEAACRRGRFDEPIATCALKRFVFDLEMKRGIDPAVPSTVSRSEKVAVIGSGPAGLTAAYDLARLGYPVSVFEAADNPGGMMNLIPGFRLPARVVKREVEAILDTGIELFTGRTFGRDITWRGLRRKGYKALLLATGAWAPDWKDGFRERPFVLHALDLLEHGERGASCGGRIGVRFEDTSVAVIGDGMLALDAARTAVRLGCRNVTCIVSRSRKLTPMLSGDLEEARAEGVSFRFLAGPAGLEKRGKNLLGVRCVPLSEGAPDRTGRREIGESGKPAFTVHADLVIDGSSRKPRIGKLGFKSGLRATFVDTLAVEMETMCTGVTAVFAAGDLVSGPRSVVEAIASGQRAALGIHAYLGGERPESVFGARGESRSSRREYAIEAEPETLYPRAGMPVEKRGRRKRDFREVETGFTDRVARLEARRCLHCGPCSECRVCTDICDRRDMFLTADERIHVPVVAGKEFWSLKHRDIVVESVSGKTEARVERIVCSVRPEMCIGCGRCGNVCGYSAVRVEVLPGGRFVARVDELACKGCGNCVSVCPTGAMDQVNFERSRLGTALSVIEPSRTIVLFACRWALPEKVDLPGEVLLIETMCTGRLTPAMLLHAVELGARKVAVCRCEESDCHYGFGGELGSVTVGRVRGILRLLGEDRRKVVSLSATPDRFAEKIGAWMKGKRLK